MNNKSIWYINCTIVIIAIAILVFGIYGMPINKLLALLGNSNGSTINAGSDGNDIIVKYPLVTAADAFSDRFRPKIVKKDPTPVKQVKPVEIKYGKVKLVIEEVEGFNGGGWKVAGSDWLESGQQADKVQVGRTHNIAFKDVEGWDSPKMTAKVKENEITELTVKYSKIIYGKAVVNIEAAEGLEQAQWQIDGKWYNSGQTVENLRAGAKTINFKAVPGWTAPDNISCTVKENELAEYSVSYSRPKPADPQFKLSATLAMGNGKGEAWFKASNSSKEQHFRIGEKVDKFVLSKVFDGSVVLTQDGFEYTVEIIKVNAPAMPKPPTNPMNAKSGYTPRQPTTNSTNSNRPETTPGSSNSRSTLPSRYQRTGSTAGSN
ncbi:MAG: hypothetical protein JEZ07_09215 [Phycisphaerae bacterium]|nr:hypothetical protein [Phycisphaerae bacterium]